MVNKRYFKDCLELRPNMKFVIFLVETTMWVSTIFMINATLIKYVKSISASYGSMTDIVKWERGIDIILAYIHPQLAKLECKLFV